jgi:hypothetical protein
MTTVESERLASVVERRSSRWVKLWAGFVALHGVAHLVGTSDALDRADQGLSIDYLAGGWHLGDPALLRVVATAWAVVAAAFVLTGVAMWIGRVGAPHLLAAVAGASLVLCVLALWAAVIGVIVDVVLLVAAAWWIARSRAASSQ